MKKAKKGLIAVLSAIMLAGAAPAYDAVQAVESKMVENASVHVLIDGQPLRSDKPVLIDGRKRFVPLRAVLEQMGWKVEWSPGLIKITYTERHISVTSNLWLKDESDIRMVNSTAYIDMYRLGEISDTVVKWIDDTSTIMVTYESVEDDESSYEEEAEQPALSEEESKKVNYGKYENSPTLDALVELSEELTREGYDIWDGIGFYPTYDLSGYFNTPLDVITFGWTGGDGEHYGFLTDFGMAASLEEAPIVMVSPMSFDQPAIVVADNIREFLRIGMVDTSLFYMNYKDEQDYLEQLEEWENESDYTLTDEEREQWEEQKRIVRERVEAKLKLPAIRDPYTYSEKVRAKREKQIIVPTEDLLGVLEVDSQAAGLNHSTIVLDEDISLIELKAFLKNATYASKLALFRDFHLHLESYFYHEDGIEETIIQEMESLGLNDELARMKATRIRYGINK
ncbi:copper amine oxidase N-terminal domain-containing protein [Paenibacillus soyae]|uniref:Copper amine oxidase N-terminal domain-containing protein n=1 Tax=Paenibacillus soyae TaxID=2969249 RepID=A0A9X2MTK0_9BACL|nr:copper amine oxidase N-terminal domain-containing protein [Paenibacillus soyae]MCR2806009.1 copper amine oxidase N-terminal domain-containing protein [Paenibacillus soyae]